MDDVTARPEVIVIGAGLTGLVAAYRLLRQGCGVTVLESNHAPGGMVSTFRMGREDLEHIYHHIFTSDRHVLDLSRELGLENRIDWLAPRNALYMNRRLFPFTTPGDLLSFSPIPLVERFRTGLAVLKASRVKDWQAMEGVTAADWLKRQSGRTAYRCLWEPLLRSKFDRDADEVSAVWIWNKFKLRGGSRDKAVDTERLGYMQGSFGVLVDGLVRAIREAGGRILFGRTVFDLGRRPEDGRFRISCIRDDGSREDGTADALVATVSGQRFASMSAGLGLPDSYMKKVRDVRYKADLCLVMRLSESLSPYYWTTVCDDLPFVLVIEHTRLTGLREYGGHIVYLSRYLDPSDPLWTESDGTIFRRFTDGLEILYPGFSRSLVQDWRVTRTRYAQPVILRDYSDRMPEMRTPVDGVFLAGMAQIYPEDRGMNYAIRLADEASDGVLDFLSKR